MTSNARLGKNQKAILNALKRNGSYFPGCGWIWSGHRTTTRYLDQLVARGLARAETYSYTHPIFKTTVNTTRYVPVAA